jgi:heme A synthase
MKLPRFAVYSWGVLAYNLAVILWGAFVRASGSGAGCGSHWPLCNGQVVPRSPQIETLIEFFHRLTSGMALLLVIGLLVWAFRAYPKRHRVRWAAGFAMLFMVTEALVGAGLVLFKLVADNASMARALWMAVHLLNTFLLLASLTLTAWWSSGSPGIQLKERKVLGSLLGLGLAGVLVLGISGAVTALGDTLFTAGSLAEGLRQDFSPTAHLLIRLRLLHPVIAVSVASYLILVAIWLSSSHRVLAIKTLAQVLILLLAVQLVVGALNVALLAPVGIQLVHLLTSDLIWIMLVLLTVSALARSPRSVPIGNLSQQSLEP